MRFIFRLRPIPLITTILVVWLGLALGNWQAHRALEKEALEHQLTLRESVPPVQMSGDLIVDDKVEYRRLQVKGQFVRDWPLYLDNRAYKGMAGFYVLMPFKIAHSSNYVLVARGWVARDHLDRTKIPKLTTPEGEIELEGIAVKSVGKLFMLGKSAVLIHPGDILQNVTLAGFAAQTRWQLQPFYLQQSNAVNDGLVRDWPRPSLDIDRHRGYRVTWYSLALMAAIFYLATGWKGENDLTKITE